MIESAVETALNETSRKQGRIASEATAKAMLSELMRGRRERYDKRLRNTKLLLRNYRALKRHIESSIYETNCEHEREEVDYYHIMNAGGTEKQYIESIRKSVHRTRLIMAHIDEMLRVYKVYCEQSGKPETARHYRVIRALYIDDKPALAQDVADAECIDKRTVYKDVDSAVEVLTPLFFGVDGIKTDF